MTYLYARTSTDKQDNSIDLQLKQLREFCLRKGFDSYTELVDDDVSGGKRLFDRPQGSRLANVGKNDTIVVMKADRLYRSFIDSVVTTNDLVERGVKLYIIQFNEEPISFENYMNEAMLYQTFIFSHMEKRQIGQRTKDGLRNRKANGKTNSAPKFGFDNLGKGKDGLEVINQSEMETLRLMKKLRNQMSAYQVADKLNELGRPTKKGGKWHGSNIDKFLYKYIHLI